MQPYCLLQLTERRFECVLECKTRVFPFAILLIIAADAAENLDVSKAAAVLDGFAHLAVERFRLKKRMQASTIVARTNLAGRVVDVLRVARTIAALARADARVRTAAVLGVFCRVCAALNAARALNIRVDNAGVAVF